MPPIGFKVISRGRVHEARTLEAAAVKLVGAYRQDTAARVRACTSLTRDRDLTAGEQRELIALATRLVVE